MIKNGLTDIKVPDFQVLSFSLPESSELMTDYYSTVSAVLNNRIGELTPIALTGNRIVNNRLKQQINKPKHKGERG